MAFPFGVSHGLVEITRINQTLLPGKTPWSIRQIETRLRPLARRALSTLRPPRVAIRALKPWVRCRLRLLGW